MSELKDQILADRVAALKAKEELTLSALRMAIAAIQNEEVSGKVARELSDAEVSAVLRREVSKRKDSAQAYADGNRPELAAKELAEAEVLQRYLPAALAESELDAIVAEEVAAAAAALGEPLGMKQLGQVIKAVNARVSGRADGGQVAAKVKAALA